MASGVSAELLKRLSVAAEGLNNVSDIFNDQVLAIEEALTSYNLGVSAWVEACTLQEEIFTKEGIPFGIEARRVNVGYEKWNGRWCLMALTYFPDDDTQERSHQWALRDAPREIRLLAVDGIPRLLEELIKEADALADKLSKKTATTRVLAASIKPKKGQ